MQKYFGLCDFNKELSLSKLELCYIDIISDYPTDLHVGYPRTNEDPIKKLTFRVSWSFHELTSASMS